VFARSFQDSGFTCIHTELQMLVYIAVLEKKKLFNEFFFLDGRLRHTLGKNCTLMDA